LEDPTTQRKAAAMCVWPSGESRSHLLDFPYTRLWTFSPRGARAVSNALFLERLGAKEARACCAVAHKRRFCGPYQLSRRQATLGPCHILPLASRSQSRDGMKGLVALKKQCGRARIYFAMGRGHNPPILQSTPARLPIDEHAE
jgi:hypothetical protein